MKNKEFDKWISRLSDVETFHTHNVTSMKELEEFLHVFHPNLVDEWKSMNHWEKLRLIEFIVNGSTRTMIDH